MEQYRFGRWKARLCHHDLVLQNMLQLDDGVRLIDWEYAGRGDPFLDLATIVEECAFGAVDRQRLLLAYGEMGEAAEERLYRARVLQRLLAVMWYLLRGRMSSNDLLPTLRRQEQGLEQLLQLGPGS